MDVPHLTNFCQVASLSSYHFEGVSCSLNLLPAVPGRECSLEKRMSEEL